MDLWPKRPPSLWLLFVYCEGVTGNLENMGREGSYLWSQIERTFAFTVNSYGMICSVTGLRSGHKGHFTTVSYGLHQEESTNDELIKTNSLKRELG